MQHNTFRQRRTNLIKIISIVLIQTFLLSNISWAAGDIMPKSSQSTLKPVVYKQVLIEKGVKQNPLLSEIKNISINKTNTASIISKSLVTIPFLDKFNELSSSFGLWYEIISHPVFVLLGISILFYLTLEIFKDNLPNSNSNKDTKDNQLLKNTNDDIYTRDLAAKIEKAKKEAANRKDKEKDNNTTLYSFIFPVLSVELLKDMSKEFVKLAKEFKDIKKIADDNINKELKADKKIRKTILLTIKSFYKAIWQKYYKVGVKLNVKKDKSGHKISEFEFEFYHIHSDGSYGKKIKFDPEDIKNKLKLWDYFQQEDQFSDRDNNSWEEFKFDFEYSKDKKSGRVKFKKDSIQHGRYLWMCFGIDITSPKEFFPKVKEAIAEKRELQSEFKLKSLFIKEGINVPLNPVVFMIDTYQENPRIVRSESTIEVSVLGNLYGIASRLGANQQSSERRLIRDYLSKGQNIMANLNYILILMASKGPMEYEGSQIAIADILEKISDKQIVDIYEFIYRYYNKLINNLNGLVRKKERNIKQNENITQINEKQNKLQRKIIFVIRLLGELLGEKSEVKLREIYDFFDNNINLSKEVKNKIVDEIIDAVKIQEWKWLVALEKKLLVQKLNDEDAKKLAFIFCGKKDKKEGYELGWFTMRNTDTNKRAIDKTETVILRRIVNKQENLDVLVDAIYNIYKSEIDTALNNLMDEKDMSEERKIEMISNSFDNFFKEYISIFIKSDCPHLINKLSPKTMAKHYMLTTKDYIKLDPIRYLQSIKNVYELEDIIYCEENIKAGSILKTICKEANYENANNIKKVWKNKIRKRLIDKRDVPYEKFYVDINKFYIYQIYYLKQVWMEMADNNEERELELSRFIALIDEDLIRWNIKKEDLQPYHIIQALNIFMNKDEQGIVKKKILSFRKNEYNEIKLISLGYIYSFEGLPVYDKKLKGFNKYEIISNNEKYEIVIDSKEPDINKIVLFHKGEKVGWSQWEKTTNGKILFKGITIIGDKENTKGKHLGYLLLNITLKYLKQFNITTIKAGKIIIPKIMPKDDSNPASIIMALKTGFISKFAIVEKEDGGFDVNFDTMKNRLKEIVENAEKIEIITTGGPYLDEPYYLITYRDKKRKLKKLKLFLREKEGGESHSITSLYMYKRHIDKLGQWINDGNVFVGGEYVLSPYNIDWLDKYIDSLPNIPVLDKFIKELEGAYIFNEETKKWEDLSITENKWKQKILKDSIQAHWKETLVRVMGPAVAGVYPYLAESNPLQRQRGKDVLSRRIFRRISAYLNLRARVAGTKGERHNVPGGKLKFNDEIGAGGKKADLIYIEADGSSVIGNAKDKGGLSMMLLGPRNSFPDLPSDMYMNKHINFANYGEKILFEDVILNRERNNNLIKGYKDRNIKPVDYQDVFKDKYRDKKIIGLINNQEIRAFLWGIYGKTKKLSGIGRSLETLVLLILSEITDVKITANPYLGGQNNQDKKMSIIEELEWAKYGFVNNKLAEMKGKDFIKSNDLLALIIPIRDEKISGFKGIERNEQGQIIEYPILIGSKIKGPHKIKLVFKTMISSLKNKIRINNLQLGYNSEKPINNEMVEKYYEKGMIKEMSELYYKLGLAYGRAALYKQAENSFNTARIIAKRNYPFIIRDINAAKHYFKGIEIMNTETKEPNKKALREFEESIKIKGHYAEKSKVMARDIYFYLGNEAYDKGNYRKAKENYNFALKLYGKSLSDKDKAVKAILEGNVAEINLTNEKQTVGLREQFYYSQLGDIYVARADAYIVLGYNGRAEYYYDKAIKMYTRGELKDKGTILAAIQLKIARLYQKRGFYKIAREEYMKIIDQNEFIKLIQGQAKKSKWRKEEIKDIQEMRSLTLLIYIIKAMAGYSVCGEVLKGKIKQEQIDERYNDFEKQLVMIKETDTYGKYKDEYLRNVQNEYSIAIDSKEARAAFKYMQTIRLADKLRFGNLLKLRLLKRDEFSKMSYELKNIILKGFVLESKNRYLKAYPVKSLRKLFAPITFYVRRYPVLSSLIAFISGAIIFSLFKEVSSEVINSFIGLPFLSSIRVYSDKRINGNLKAYLEEQREKYIREGNDEYANVYSKSLTDLDNNPGLPAGVVLYALGEGFTKLNKNNKAIFYTKEALKVLEKKDKNNRSGIFMVYSTLADLYFKEYRTTNNKEYLKESLNSLKKMDDVYINNPIVLRRGLFIKGMIFYVLERYRDAFVCMQASLKELKKENIGKKEEEFIDSIIKVKTMIAACKVNIGSNDNLQEGIEMLLDVIKVDADIDDELRIIQYESLAKAYYKTENFKSAKVFFDKALEIAKNNKDIYGAYIPKLMFEYAQTEREIGEFKDAETDFINAIKTQLVYSNDEGHLEAGMDELLKICDELYNNYKFDEEDINDLSEIFSDLAELYVKMDKIEDAKNVLKVIIGWEVDIENKKVLSSMYYLQGIISQKESNAQGAIESFNSAIKIYPKEPKYYESLIDIYMQSKKYKEALKVDIASEKIGLILNKRVSLNVKILMQIIENEFKGISEIKKKEKKEYYEIIGMVLINILSALKIDLSNDISLKEMIKFKHTLGEFIKIESKKKKSDIKLNLSQVMDALQLKIDNENEKIRIYQKEINAYRQRCAYLTQKLRQIKPIGQRVSYDEMVKGDDSYLGLIWCVKDIEKDIVNNRLEKYLTVEFEKMKKEYENALPNIISHLKNSCVYLAEDYEKVLSVNEIKLFNKLEEIVNSSYFELNDELKQAIAEQLRDLNFQRKLAAQRIKDDREKISAIASLAREVEEFKNSNKIDIKQFENLLSQLPLYLNYVDSTIGCDEEISLQDLHKMLVNILQIKANIYHISPTEKNVIKWVDKFSNKFSYDDIKEMLLTLKNPYSTIGKNIQPIVSKTIASGAAHNVHIRDGKSKEILCSFKIEVNKNKVNIVLNRGNQASFKIKIARNLLREYIEWKLLKYKNDFPASFNLNIIVGDAPIACVNKKDNLFELHYKIFTETKEMLNENGEFIYNLLKDESMFLHLYQENIKKWFISVKQSSYENPGTKILQQLKFVLIDFAFTHELSHYRSKIRDRVEQEKEAINYNIKILLKDYNLLAQLYILLILSDNNPNGIELRNGDSFDRILYDAFNKFYTQYKKNAEETLSNNILQAGISRHAKNRLVFENVKIKKQPKTKFQESLTSSL